MLAIKNTVLIIRLDCPMGIQQYWALIPPEAGSDQGDILLSSAYQPSTVPHVSPPMSGVSSTSSLATAMSVSASFKYSSWGRGGLDTEASSAERRSVKHMVRSPLISTHHS
jgi:hypothetical protein